MHHQVLGSSMGYNVMYFYVPYIIFRLNIGPTCTMFSIEENQQIIVNFSLFLQILVRMRSLVVVFGRAVDIVIQLLHIIVI